MRSFFFLATAIAYRTCCVDTATAVLHAVVDRFLVNIQTDVVHSLHGGASLVVSESARSLSSAFLHQALLHDLFIQTSERLGLPGKLVWGQMAFPSVWKLLGRRVLRFQRA